MSDYQVGYKKPPTSAQWPKGTSGNPSGTVAGTPKVSTAIMKYLRCGANERFKIATRSDRIGAALCRKAEKGNIEAIKEVLNRSEGKVPDVVHYHDEGTRIQLAARILVMKFGIANDEAMQLVEQAATAALEDGKE